MVGPIPPLQPRSYFASHCHRIAWKHVFLAVLVPTVLAFVAAEGAASEVIGMIDPAITVRGGLEFDADQVSARRAVAPTVREPFYLRAAMVPFAWGLTTLVVYAAIWLSERTESLRGTAALVGWATVPVAVGWLAWYGWLTLTLPNGTEDVGYEFANDIVAVLADPMYFLLALAALVWTGAIAHAGAVEGFGFESNGATGITLLVVVFLGSRLVI